MNNEIKEMLEQMESISITGKNKNGIKVDGYGLGQNELKMFLDYITNLQQENERLKLELSGYREAILRDDKLLGLQQENERLKEWKKDLLNENIELENIRKETIEYIKYRKEEYDNAGTTRLGINFQHYNKLINDLLNILQNGSEDNVSDRD